jgi:hypothetical protein
MGAAVGGLVNGVGSGLGCLLSLLSSTAGTWSTNLYNLRNGMAHLSSLSHRLLLHYTPAAPFMAEAATSGFSRAKLTAAEPALAASCGFFFRYSSISASPPV